MFIMVVGCSHQGIESVEEQVSTDVGHKIQASKSNLMARGVTLDLLQMAKRVGPQ